MLNALTQASATITGPACTQTPIDDLDDTDLTAAIDATVRLANQVAGLQVRLIGEFDTRKLAKRHGASSTTAWLRHRLHINPAAAGMRVHLGAAMSTNPHLADALTAGTITAEQAAAIQAAINTTLPEATPEQTTQATDQLLDHAQRYDPAMLRRAGATLLPDLAINPTAARHDNTERAERAARAAWHNRGLHLHDTHDGRTHITGWLDDTGAALLAAALDPLCKPVPGETRTAAQRRADALIDIANRVLRSADLPTSGGQPTQVVITMDLDDLRDQLGTATLDTGGTLTPAQTRRMACDAQLIPAVLRGASEVLDLGRAHRLISPALRRALTLRDKGCAFTGCDRSPKWCEGHHIVHWIDDGLTALDNTMLLCRFHHGLIHTEGWTATLGPDGHPHFTPPSWTVAIPSQYQQPPKTER